MPLRFNPRRSSLAGSPASRWMRSTSPLVRGTSTFLAEELSLVLLIIINPPFVRSRGAKLPCHLLRLQFSSTPLYRPGAYVDTAYFMALSPHLSSSGISVRLFE